MTNAQAIESKGIKLKKTSGQVKTLCPECSHTRKDKTDLCLSVDIDKGVWNCHHCGFKGGVNNFKIEKKEYVKPQPRLEKLSSKTLKWFEEERKISNNTLLRLKLTEAKGNGVTYTCFNYYREGELINIKFRDDKKGFRLAKDAELIFYNLDAIKDESECVIVEGEIDCLTLHECGIYNVVSVPNGASKGSQKLEYLDNCWQYFEGMKKIILMVDSDEAGYSLREELARRLGKDRCFKVTYPEGCKDANEVLVKFGPDKVKEVYSTCFEWPIEGILTTGEMLEDVVNFYENGYPGGIKIGIPGLDELIQLMPGQFTTITGIPGSGKSEVADWIMTKTSENNKWGWAVCSFENQPCAFHITKLIEKHAGKSFAYRFNSSDRVTQDQLQEGVLFVDSFFHFINLNEIDTTLDGILSKAAELVVRKGIKGLIIDPWNYIEHKIPKGYTETQYISESLTKIKSFTIKYGVHILLVAHPTKLQKDKVTNKYEVPTLYNISGSAHFFNKTDNGISVYRDFKTNQVDIYVQKVRFSWLGRVGFASFNFDVRTRQYDYVSVV